MRLVDLSTFFILNVIISLVFQGLLHWVVRNDYILNIDSLTKMMSAIQTSSNYFQEAECCLDSRWHKEKIGLSNKGKGLGINLSIEHKLKISKSISYNWC